MSSTYRRITLAGALICALLMGPVLAHAQVNMLSNGGFEIANPTLGWNGISSWSSPGDQWGGAALGTAGAYAGSNVMRIISYGGFSHLLLQGRPATAGKIYEADGWLKTPAGTDNFKPTNGYVTILFRFFNSGGTRVGENCESVRFQANGPTTWTRYTTGPCLAPAGAVTAEVSCFYYRGFPTDGTVTGSVYFDEMRLYTSTATRAGALFNPDFEVQPFSDLTAVPYWQGLGSAGAVVTNVARNGRTSLQIWYPETLAAQTWVATAGTRYACSGYMIKTNAITTTNNAHGVILLQFFDATGAQLGNSFESTYLTKTNATNVWIYGLASGVAPVGTVTGRTLCAVLGSDSAFSGSIFFDDVNQTSIPTSDTVSGLLHNPGFDDGAAGNAYDLDLSSGLPYWKWLGGTNAGFVTDSYEYDGVQSLAITYPANMAAQRAAAVTGRTYILHGYMSSPVGQDLSNSAYGVYFKEFYSTSYKGGTSIVSVAESPHFTSNYAAGTWYKFSITNTAPWTGSVTCRVLTAVMGSTSNYGGAVYFDGLTLIETNIARANSQSGAHWNPGFEYTANGTVFDAIDNWTNFGNAGNVDNLYTRSGIRSLKIYYPGQLLLQNWSATQGYTYASSAYAYTPSGADRFSGGTNTYGLVVLEFLDATGTNVVGSYPSPWFRTTNAAGAWTLLSVTGKAPLGAVSARTMVGMLGSTSSFSGVLWFDDVSQSLVSTGGTTQSGAIFNGGFDDGVVGNCYYLSNNLPSWTWAGGSNAGFIVSDLAQSNSQSLTIVWPGNLSYQNFAAKTGLTYTVEGYMYTPSGANRMTGTTAYAQFLLEFFTPVGGSTSVSVVGSAKLTNGTTAGTWIKFGVTNRAPYVGAWVTGRVSCALLGGAENFGGQVYFDSVRVSVTTVTVNNTTNGTIRNPSFDYSADGTRLSFIDNWQGLGLDGIVDSQFKRSGSQSLKIYVPETLAAQSWPATAGYRYSSSAYAYTPTETVGSDILVNGSLSLVGVAQAPTSWTSFDDGSHEADYWHVLSPTNSWMFYWSGGIYQDITSGFVPGERYKFGGSFFMESGSAFTNSKYGAIELEFYNATNGLISKASAYPFCASNSVKDSWFNSSASANVPAGTTKMRVIVRCNVPSGDGDGSFAADNIYLKKVIPAAAEKFTAAYDTHGVVLLQYLNSTGGVITTYESAYFTEASTAGAWTNLLASGIAPVGTVSGRTVVAILGSSVGFGGALWFDDVSQSLVSTGATQSGLIWNGGFDDGIVGNCYYLSNNLPNWIWAGGTNAGFVVDTVSQNTNQSLTIVWPGNLSYQNFAAKTGLTYTVEGYMYTPSGANRMTGTTAYAQFLLEFFTPVGGSTSVSVVGSAKLTNGTTAGTWIKFGVTNRAPYVGAWVTGRVSCALLGGAENFGGQVYFDSVRVSVTTVTVNNTTNGTIRNPSFDYSADGTRLSFIDNWQGLGLDGIVDSQFKRSGSQSLKIYVPETLAAQSWPATAGYRYSSSAYAYTPTETVGSDILVNGSLSLVGVAQAPTSWTSFDDGSHEADYWHVLSPTNSWMFYWGGGIYQDITSGFVPGERYTFGGAFFMESGNPLRNGDKHGRIQVEFYNATNGLISSATAYPMVQTNSVRDAWFGSSGSVTVPAGATTMRVLVRCNQTTGGDGSFAADDIYVKKVVPAVAEKFAGQHGTHGVVLLQYLNSTGGVLITYESPYFTTNTTAGVWTNLAVSGVAPAGTVSGRTVVAILGSSDGFSGALWFDDVTQSYVSSGTVSGLLHNPSFEDGPSGNCYNLQTNNDLPSWTWNGGDNAGFIATDYVKDGSQSLVITYPLNGVAQTIALDTNGQTYTASGYLFTPSASRFTSDGTSYGLLDLSFYANGFYVTNYTSQRFGGDTPADQWTNFTVSGAAPAGTGITAVLSCTIYSANPGEDYNLGGVIYFDHLTLTGSSGGQPSEWAQWQQSNFGSTNGANTGLYEDYDNDGYVNWNEFVAGTQPTNGGSLLSSLSVRQGTNTYVIRWPSVAGRYYKVNRSTNLAANGFAAITGGLAATAPENVYTDSPPTSVTLYYYRVSVTTNMP